MRHVDSGWRCLVAHADHGQCMKCSVCGQWVSPLAVAGTCPGSPVRQEPKDYIMGTTKNKLIGEWTVDPPSLMVLYEDTPREK